MIPLLMALFSFAQPTANADVALYQGELSPEGISSFIQANQISTTDDLLSRMPDRLLSSFTLASTSQSIQAACTSAATPRVILFSPDDDFAMAVTGNLQTTGCGNIEMMKFERSTSSFNFKEYVMGPNGGLNSQSCLQCHSNDPRPIWNSYNEWPGFYGEEDDIVDQTSFLSSKKTWMGKQVYQRLGWNGQTTSFPFRTSEPSLDAGMRPNLRLSMMFSREESTRLARVLESQAGFSSYQDAILFHYLNCGTFANSTNDSNIDALFKMGYMAEQAPGTIFKPDTYALNEVIGDAVTSESDFYDGTDYVDAFVTSSLMKDMTKTDADLAPYFQTQSISAYYGTATSNQLFPPTEDLGWIDGMNEVLNQSNNSALCALLQKKTSAALQAIRGQPLVPLQATLAQAPLPPPGSSQSAIVFSTCLDCHNGSGTAPMIPFSNDTEFRTALTQTGYPQGTLYSEIYHRVFETSGTDKMPIGTPLTSAELRAIADYLGSLSTL